jgi:hypothetical protein
VARYSLLFALLLHACAPSRADIDRDLDGAEDAIDCRPDDPTSFPGARDRCDGLDNDCDGLIDDGTGTPWFRDLDGDGHGDARQRVLACQQPAEGWADRDTDCDDDDPEAHPGALERCNGLDDNCDDRIDEPFFDAPLDQPLPVGTLVLNGAAYHIERDAELELVPSETNVRGSIWYQRARPVDGLRIRFELRLDEGRGDGIAVGLLSALQPDLIGVGGGLLGIYGVGAEGVVVELDGQPTGPEDPPWAHVAVADAADRAPFAVSEAAALHGEAWREVQIEVERGQLRVSLAGEPVVQASLPDDLPDQVMLGFTSGNTTLVERATIRAVELGCIDP